MELLIMPLVILCGLFLIWLSADPFSWHGSMRALASFPSLRVKQTWRGLQEVVAPRSEIQDEAEADEALEQRPPEDVLLAELLNEMVELRTQLSELRAEVERLSQPSLAGIGRRARRGDAL